jgi:hypothetical protein
MYRQFHSEYKHPCYISQDFVGLQQYCIKHQEGFNLSTRKTPALLILFQLLYLLNILFHVLPIQEKPDLKSEEKAMDDGSSSDGANDGGDSDTNNGPVQD